MKNNARDSAAASEAKVKQTFKVLSFYSTNVIITDVCEFPRDPGSCDAFVAKYYYDNQRGTCERFKYGGCGGNGNRFSSSEECESVCLTRQEPHPNVVSTGKSLCKSKQFS